jgi:tetratricopeptide (TPR) repeat protein
MDKPAAIAACQRAVAADPNNPRLNYLLGRAYGYSDRGEEAMPYRLKALEADYP